MSVKKLSRPFTCANQHLQNAARPSICCQFTWATPTTSSLFMKGKLNAFELIRPYSTPSSNNTIFGINASNSNIPPSYFQRSSLPTNTIIRFVPQQTAWIVERMGKFNRILEPGFALLYPIIDRIAYVKSLKETALEIPSQSAITADNVTLELDGVLYTRIFDAYKAR